MAYQRYFNKPLIQYHEMHQNVMVDGVLTISDEDVEASTRMISISTNHVPLKFGKLLVKLT